MNAIGGFVITCNKQVLKAIISSANAQFWSEIEAGRYHGCYANSWFNFLKYLNVKPTNAETQKGLPHILKKYIGVPELFTYLFEECYARGAGFHFNTIAKIFRGLTSNPRLSRLLRFCTKIDELTEKQLRAMFENIRIDQANSDEEFRFHLDDNLHDVRQIKTAISMYMISRGLRQFHSLTDFMYLAILAILNGEESPFKYFYKHEIPAELYKYVYPKE